MVCACEDGSIWQPVAFLPTIFHFEIDVEYNITALIRMRGEKIPYWRKTDEYEYVLRHGTQKTTNP